MPTFTLPTINADDDAWGATLNTDLTTLNGIFPDLATLKLVEGGNNVTMGLLSNVLTWKFNSTTRAQMNSGGLLTVNGLALPSGGTLTLVSDTLTIGSFSRYIVDTEGAAATDNLSTISGGTAGQMLILSSASSARDITLVDNTNLRLAGNANFTLDDTDDFVWLYCLNGTVWISIALQNIS